MNNCKEKFTCKIPQPGICDIKTLIDGNEVFMEFKGALTEQFVFQQLLNEDSVNICYWSADKSTAEVDFVIQSRGRIIPIEVKADDWRGLSDY